MGAERDIWEISIGLYGTEEQVHEIVESVTTAICADPDHPPPCPVPWSITTDRAPDTRYSYPELVEQYEIESRRG